MSKEIENLELHHRIDENTVNVRRGKIVWFPDYREVIRADAFRKIPNNYARSVVIGLTAPFLNLPIILINECLKPFALGLFFTLSFTLHLMKFGLKGDLVGLRIFYNENVHLTKESQKEVLNTFRQQGNIVE